MWDDRSRSAVWSRGAGLLENMAAVLQRRLIDASRATGEGLPLWSSAGAEFRDLLRLWHGDLDAERVEDLIHALALVDFIPRRIGSAGRQVEQPEDRGSADRAAGYQADFDAACELPRAYALLKLCFVGGWLPPRPTPTGAAMRAGDEKFPPMAPEILNLLLAGKVSDALTVAARRLRAKGYPPIVPDRAFRTGEFTATTAEGPRLASLLLVPVRRPGILVRLAIKSTSKL
jgi:CRISPR-associated protein Csx17